MDGGASKTIIIKKKKAAEHGHHGGSWKVAYADFVTAMMAFFLVMWIMSMDAGVKDMVQGYFQNPVGFKRSFSGGKNILSAGNFMRNIEIRRTVIFNREEQQASFEHAASKIKEGLEEGGLLKDLDAAVETTITQDGLRIEIMETGGSPVFFDKASAKLQPRLVEVLGVIAGGLADSESDVIIEGHTDALPFGGPQYTNWELSAERANAARRALVAAALPPDRVIEVRGYAALHLKVKDDALDPRNRRISVLLPFKEVPVESLPPVEREQIQEYEKQTGGIG